MRDFLKRSIRSIRSRYWSVLGLDNIRIQQYFSFFERQNANLLTKEFAVQDFIDCSGLVINPVNIQNSTALKHINCLMPKAVFSHKVSDIPYADEYSLWGNLYSQSKTAHAILANAVMRGKIVYILEDGFFKSATTWADIGEPIEFRTGISFTIDDLTCYYDSLYPSRLELKLNSECILSQEEFLRAKKTINFIVENKLTKYNHQPIVKPYSGRRVVKKVLVIDQSYNDFSIIRCRANDHTFKRMLSAAMSENPDADIIVKTHPDTISNSSERSGYYVHLKESGRLITQREAINPICLLQEMDKVYVCSSQMGFEALMCGCDVVTFGMPFYAGWGQTDDRHPGFLTPEMVERRNKQRSIKEIFYYAYIWYSHYVNPDSQAVCEIEEALQYLLKIRNRFFQK